MNELPELHAAGGEQADPPSVGHGCPWLAAMAAGQPLAFPIPRTKPLDPPAEYAGLRAETPFLKVRLWDGKEAWLVSRYEHFRAILSDPRFSADITRPNYPTISAGMGVARGKYRSLISMDPPEHTVQRRMIAGEFTIKRIESMRPRLQAIVDDLIDRMLARGGPADLVADFALPFPSLAICELLGVPYADHDFFQSRARILVAHTTTTEQANAATVELCDYLRSLIREKDRNPTDDILSRLVVQRVRTGAMSEEELVGLSRFLLVAGHETTANMTAMGALLLMQHPEQRQELRDEPELMPQAVEELLRYLDVTHLGRRRVATEDVRLGDHLIRVGEGVVVLSVSANRDEDVFERPDEFDIHREARHHVTFGYGVHQCLGQPLARVELQIALGTLIRRMPGLRLASPMESLHFNEDMFIYGLRALPVQW
ncbi:cytochrome P450 [Amorphus sp. MBR-141]